MQAPRLPDDCPCIEEGVVAQNIFPLIGADPVIVEAYLSRRVPALEPPVGDLQDRVAPALEEKGDMDIVVGMSSPALDLNLSQLHGILDIRLREFLKHVQESLLLRIVPA